MTQKQNGAVRTVHLTFLPAFLFLYAKKVMTNCAVSNNNLMDPSKHLRLAEYLPVLIFIAASHPQKLFYYTSKESEARKRTEED